MYKSNYGERAKLYPKLYFHDAKAEKFFYRPDEPLPNYII